MSIKYATIDSHRSGTGDEFTREYSTAAEALAAARSDWAKLTIDERRKRTISAVRSEETDDGEFNWGSYDVIFEFNDVRDTDYGTVFFKVGEFEKEFRLIEYGNVVNDSRYDRDGNDDAPPVRTYHAHAIDENGDRFLVVWVTRDDFWTHQDADGHWVHDEDEGNACDWEHPVSVEGI